MILFRQNPYTPRKVIVDWWVGQITFNIKEKGGPVFIRNVNQVIVRDVISDNRYESVDQAIVLMNDGEKITLALPSIGDPDNLVGIMHETFIVVVEKLERIMKIYEVDPKNLSRLEFSRIKRLKYYQNRFGPHITMDDIPKGKEQ